MAIKLDPQKPGTYYVSYGKRNPKTRVPLTLKRTGFKTKAEAKRAYDELVVLVHRKIEEEVVPFWNVVIDEYIQVRRIEGLSEKTLYDYETSLKAYTVKQWKGKIITDITPEDIRNVVQVVMKDKSDWHRRNMLRMIRTVMTFALDRNYLQRNPTPQIKIRITNKEKLVLTKNEVQKFLAHSAEYEHEWHPIWTVALYTGMRSGELYAIQWEDVDLERNVFYVRRSWNNKAGFKSTKSGHERKVPILEELKPILEKLRLKTGATGFVLPRMDDWDRGMQARILRTFLAGMGLPQIRFHDLRATWATMLLSSGEPPAKVMLVGGWRDMKTMMIYMRKAGIDLQGFGTGLNLITPVQNAEIIELKKPSGSGL